MKCEVIRDDLEAYVPHIDEAHRPHTVERTVWRNGREEVATFWKRGAIIDNPQAYYLVRQGVAKPADAECEKRAGMSPEDARKAAYAYERLSRGIHPEDFAAYDAGWIAGYNPDGSFIPGPNHAEMPVETEYEDEDE